MPQEDLSKLRIDKSGLPTRRGRKKRIILAVMILILASVLWWLNKNNLLRPAAKVQIYHVQPMFPAQTFTRLNASGYVVAQRKSAVAAKVTAQLVELAVEEGSRVRQGDIIARLEDRDTRAARERAAANVQLAEFQLKQAQAELKDARLNFERQEALLERGVVPRAQLDAAEARYKGGLAAVRALEAAVQAATAALKEAQVALEYTVIRAPFDAVVLTKNADIGDIVTPLGAAANAKSAVVTIADMDSLMVEVDVSESNIGIVVVGQPCEIQLDALPGERFPGKVYMIVPTADRSKASVLVKVAFNRLDPRVLPEMSAKVAFLERSVTPEEEQAVLAVPVAAVLGLKDAPRVFRVKDDSALETRVKPGRELGSMLEIVEGLQAGDRVILAPPPTLKNLSRVEIRE